MHFFPKQKHKTHDDTKYHLSLVFIYTNTKVSDQQVVQCIQIFNKTQFFVLPHTKNQEMNAAWNV